MALLAGNLPTPARATAFCEILSTRDGFVALREGPSVGTKLILRLKPGEDVQLDSTRKAQGGFEPVIYWGADRSKMVAGWVARRLISKECG